MNKNFSIGFVTLLLSAFGCAHAQPWIICSGPQGVAIVSSHQVCGGVEKMHFIRSGVDLGDPDTIKAVGTATLLISQLSESSSDVEYLGPEVVSELSIKQMNAVSEVSPDFANTLGPLIYRLNFSLDSQEKIELLIETGSGEHEWVRIIE